MFPQPLGDHRATSVSVLELRDLWTAAMTSQSLRRDEFVTFQTKNKSEKWAREIGARAKSRGIKINCVAMMQPKAHDDMDDLAKRTGGHFTIVMQGGQRKKVR